MDSLLDYIARYVNEHEAEYQEWLKKKGVSRMTREELRQLQSIQHKLDWLRQRELADSGDTFKSIIWRSQSHGEVVAYDNALVLINEFLKGQVK